MDQQHELLQQSSNIFEQPQFDTLALLAEYPYYFGRYLYEKKMEHRVTTSTRETITEVQLMLRPL